MGPDANALVGLNDGKVMVSLTIVLWTRIWLHGDTITLPVRVLFMKIMDAGVSTITFKRTWDWLFITKVDVAVVDMATEPV